jgi:uncharacterized membrane protein
MLALAGFAVLSGPTGPACAIEIINPAGGNALASEQRDGELQALRNQVQRQQFQQQQQQYRAQDRRVVTPPVLEVPRLKPTCQMQVYGNDYLKSCR